MSAQNQVWILEDEKDLAEIYADYLKRDFRPRVFGSPEEAMNAWKAEGSGPDLLVSDLKMPGKDGLEFVSELRSNGMKSPVVMMSGFAEKAHLMEAQRLGVTAFLEKPFDPKTLVAKAREALRLVHAQVFVEELLPLFREERRLHDELIRACVDRYAKAENIAEEEGRLFDTDRDSREAFLAMLYGENKRLRDLGALQKKIDQLLSELNL